MNRILVGTCLFVVYIISLANGHSYFSSITIDGVVHSEGDCMRPHPSSQYDYPISGVDRPSGLASNDMTCGWLPAASRAANKKCAVNPGSKITLQWHYEMGLSNDNFIIDPSHRGPCLVYMAKSETGSGNVWFKIFEEGYNTTSKKFCVDRMRANGGKFDVTIPTDIAPGNYLLRGELIALHEGHELNGAQPYVGCAELTVGGSGTKNPTGVAIPGAYAARDPGIYFNIYNGISSYPIPGPAVYVSGSSSGSNTGSTPATTARAAVTTGKVTTGKVTTGRPSVTTGKLTTGRAAVTTGRASGSSGSTTAKVTTGKTPVTTARNVASVTTGVEEMCYKPGTPNINGKINTNPPTCGRNSRRARCAEGLCCSQYGYCGPFKNSDGTYKEYIGGSYKVVSEEVAFGLYCNNQSYADYRKIPCSSVGQYQNQANSGGYNDDRLLSGATSLSSPFFMIFSFIFGVLLVSSFTSRR